MAALARALETLSIVPPPDPMGEGIGALADLALHHLAVALQLRVLARRVPIVAGTGDDPGRVDSPPTSTMSAPSSIRR